MGCSPSWPGDDVRTIDWRVTARTQTPHTKLFQEEKERPVLILADQCAGMFFGSRVRFKSVAAAEAAALVAWLHLREGDRVGGIVFSDTGHREVRPRRSKHSVLRFVHELHDFNQALNRECTHGGSQPLTEALSNVRRVARHGCAVYLITDFRNLDDQGLLHLRQIARHNDIVGIQVFDPMERELPAPSTYTISDGNQRVRIDAARAANRNRYETLFATFASDIAAEFSRLKAQLYTLSTTESMAGQLALDRTQVSA